MDLQRGISRVKDCRSKAFPPECVSVLFGRDFIIVTQSLKGEEHND